MFKLLLAVAGLAADVVADKATEVVQKATGAYDKVMDEAEDWGEKYAKFPDDRLIEEARRAGSLSSARRIAIHRELSNRGIIS